jgi:hypothetical protein
MPLKMLRPHLRRRYPLGTARTEASRCRAADRRGQGVAPGGAEASAQALSVTRMRQAGGRGGVMAGVHTLDDPIP